MKRNRKIDDVYSLAEGLKDLIEAKELLDSILSYYDIYSGQFEKIPDYDSQSYFVNPYDKKTYFNTLNNRIRGYKEFDDSEQSKSEDFSQKMLAFSERNLQIRDMKIKITKIEE